MLGRTIAGKYRIEAPLGSGSMGDVWRATHLALDAPVALKIMRAELAKDEAFRERFHREAKAASKLSHANSVRVIDVGVEDDGLVYIAMELLEGRDLFTIVKHEFPLSDARIVGIMSQTLTALAAAHALGIVHRDLKPENIMVSMQPDEDGQLRDHVKVCDFGIAKMADPATFKTNDDGRALTKTGTIMGTPEYMSPEQARGESLDARTDLYSMGIVLYQMLTGKLPFTGEGVLTIVLKQVTDAPVPPSELKPDVNLALENVCLRAMRKEKAERYQTAKEMRADIRAAIHLHDTSGRYPPYEPVSEPTLPAIDPSNPEIGSAKTVVMPPASSARSRTMDALAASAMPRPGTPKWLYPLIAIPALFVGAVAFFILFHKADDKGGERGTDASATVADQHETPSDPIAPLPTGSQKHHGDGRVPVPSARPKTTASVAPSTSVAPATTAVPVVTTVDASAPPLASTAAPSNYNPASAFVALGQLSTSGVSRDPISKKMNGALAQLSECYRDSLVNNGSPKPGSAQIQMSIDDAGRVTTIVIADKNASFQRCAARAVGSFSVDKSTLTEAAASATQWLTLNP